MRLESHIDHLKERHMHMDENIEHAELHHFSDEKVKQMKVEKLHLKDMIVTLEEQLLDIPEGTEH